MSRLWLEGPDGTIMDIDGLLQDGSLTAVATSGFGMPNQSPRRFSGAGDGAQWRGSRTPSRELQIDLRGDSVPLDMLRDLGRVFDPVRPSRVWVKTTDGSVWWLSVFRSGGGDFRHGRDTDRRTWLHTVLILESTGSPWWTAEAAVEHAITVGGDSEGLLDPFSLAELELTDGQAFGQVEVNNTGDAPAVLRVLVTGPGQDIELVSPSGVSLLWEDTLGSGETLTFDFEAATVVDGTGANRYGGLTVGKARFWPLPAGVSTVTAAMDGASSASEIRLQWFPRRQAVV